MEEDKKKVVSDSDKEKMNKTAFLIIGCVLCFILFIFVLAQMH